MLCRLQVIDYGVAAELVPPSGRAVATLPPNANFVGAGLGLIGAAGLAALAGADCSFVRAAPKGHGTRRQHDGAWAPGRPIVAVWTTEADRAVIERCVPSVDHSVRVETLAAGPAAGQAPMPRADLNHALVADLASRVLRLADGPYIRSNGEVADYYLETLTAAHTYEVAATFAAAVTLDPAVDASVGVMLGGVYLAAVMAVRHGLRLLMIDPKVKSAHGGRWSSKPAAAVFVDDMMNSGKAFRSCARHAESVAISSYTYATLYSFGRDVSLAGPPPVVGAVISE